MSIGVTLIEINEIDFGLSYDGYLWYSDDQKPKLSSDSDFNFEANSFSNLPFIIEGNLYSEEKGISINIKYRDGKHHIVQFDIKIAQENFICDEQEYIGHDIKEQNFKMIEAWKKESGGEELADMPTLVPAWSAFIGFVNKK